MAACSSLRTPTLSDCDGVSDVLLGLAACPSLHTLTRVRCSDARDASELEACPSMHLHTSVSMPVSCLLFTDAETVPFKII